MEKERKRELFSYNDKDTKKMEEERTVFLKKSLRVARLKTDREREPHPRGRGSAPSGQSLTWRGQSGVLVGRLLVDVLQLSGVTGPAGSSVDVRRPAPRDARDGGRRRRR